MSTLHLQYFFVFWTVEKCTKKIYGKHWISDHRTCHSNKTREMEAIPKCATQRKTILIHLLVLIFTERSADLSTPCVLNGSHFENCGVPSAGIPDKAQRMSFLLLEFRIDTAWAAALSNSKSSEISNECLAVRKT